ncbi:MAG: GntR family transcriptional regulator [Paracoccaceae bacterium]
MPPLPRSTRVTTAYDRLRHDILNTRLPPGFQATEPEWAARLGMSRTPVHEALLRLDHDGLVELIPRRGARVLPVSPQDMAEIYEILAALEPEAAAGLAARARDQRDLSDLITAQNQMETALDADDLDAWAKADDAFHRGLLTAYGNRRMACYLGTLYDQAHRARMVTLRLRARPLASTRDHRAILTALQTGDAGTVRDLFRAHRARTARELLALLDAYRLPQL